MSQFAKLTIPVFSHMLNLMPRKTSEQGITHLLSLFLIALLVGIVISTNIPVGRDYLSGRGDNVLGTHTDRVNLKIVTDNEKVGFINNTDGAVSEFPLTLDPATKDLKVTTSAGERIVAVLPDEAIKNMLASGVMSYVTSVPAEGELASTDKLVSLIERDGMLIYEVDGVREYKLLGLIPLKSKVKAFVSAENGQVIGTEQSLFGRFLNRIAP